MQADARYRSRRCFAISALAPVPAVFPNFQFAENYCLRRYARLSRMFRATV